MSAIDNFGNQQQGATVTHIDDAREVDDEAANQQVSGYDDAEGDPGYEQVEPEVEVDADPNANDKKKRLITVGMYAAGALVAAFILYQVGGKLGLIKKGPPPEDTAPVAMNFSQPSQPQVAPIAAVPAQLTPDPVAPMPAKADGQSQGETIPASPNAAAPVSPHPAPAPVTSAAQEVNAQAPVKPIDTTVVAAAVKPVQSDVPSGQIDQLKSELTELRARVATLESKAQRPAQAPAAQAKNTPVASAVKAVQPASSKPAIGVKPLVTTKASTDAGKSDKPASAASGKLGVRGDYKMYAVRDGRAWVKSVKDGEIVMVGADSSLPDGTRVKSINEEIGVIVTNAGDIR